MTILPCPNTECRGPGKLDKSKGGAAHWVECGSACGVEGPSAGHAEKAVALWNALPREAEWVRVDSGDRPEANALIDVVWRRGEWANWFVYECATYRPEATSPFRSSDGIPFLEGNVSHWRIHTPPRMPKR